MTNSEYLNTLPDKEINETITNETADMDLEEFGVWLETERK